MKKYTFTSFIIILILFSSFITSAQNNCANFTVSQSDIGLASETFGVSLADFNGDGWKDVVIIDAYDDIEVYFYDTINDKMGTTALELGIDAWRFGVEVIDIENDGDWDFITSPFSSSASGNGIEVWENDGSGNFTLKASGVGGNASGYEFAVGDLNGDGFSDIFFPHGDIDILLNDENGNFISNGQTNLNTSSPEAVVLADFDNDNDLDAAVVRGGGSGFVGKIYINDGSGQFSDSGQELSSGNEGIDAADIDADGDIDLVIAPWHGRVKIFLNNGTGNFIPGDTLNNVNAFYDDIKLLDQNLDGYPDIFTTNHIWLNDASNPGNFILQDFSINIPTHDFEVTDINNDGFLDIYVGRFSSTDGDNIYLSNEPTINDVTETICFGDSVFLQNEWQTQAGTYFENSGCEIYTNTVLSVYDEINILVSSSSVSFTANENNANYQWLDCNDNYSVISGESSQSFVPFQSGSFAVEITQNGICADTSDCIDFVFVGIEENTLNEINIFPNPTSGILSIESSQNIENIEILDITGRVVFRDTKAYNTSTIDLSDENTGVYFVKIQSNNSIFTQKIIIK